MDGSLPTILFIDPCTPRPYSPSTKDGPGIGGTEQTVITLAEGLGTAKEFNVVVEQHNRAKEDVEVHNATYACFGHTPAARFVVVLRESRILPQVRKRFPNSKIYLWSHDLAGATIGNSFLQNDFEGCSANVCVSQWHRTQTIETLKVFGYTGQFRTRAVYNPLSEDVIRTDEKYDKNKLVWLASPHKGLSRAFELLKLLLRINKEFKLYVTNPGYLLDQNTDDKEIKDSVVSLGTVSHVEAMSHLRSALCLFYPNTVFPETFGKILAEANAVGTPVLTAPIGASREVLDPHPGQIVDCKNDEAVIRRVLEWHDGARPLVRGNPKFKLSSVIEEWKRLFNDTR